MLKNEKIIEFEIKVPTSDFNNYENQYFSRRNINKEEIFKLMEINNVNENQFYDMLYTDIAWQILISKRYYRVTAVPDEEIKRLVKSDPEISDELAEKMIVDKQLSLKSSKMLRDLRSEATIFAIRSSFFVMMVFTAFPPCPMLLTIEPWVGTLLIAPLIIPPTIKIRLSPNLICGRNFCTIT